MATTQLEVNRPKQRQRRWLGRAAAQCHRQAQAAGSRDRQQGRRAEAESKRGGTCLRPRSASRQRCRHGCLRSTAPLQLGPAAAQSLPCQPRPLRPRPAAPVPAAASRWKAWLSPPAAPAAGPPEGRLPARRHPAAAQSPLRQQAAALRRARRLRARPGRGAPPQGAPLLPLPWPWPWLSLSASSSCWTRRWTSAEPGSPARCSTQGRTARGAPRSTVDRAAATLARWQQSRQQRRQRVDGAQGLPRHVTECSMLPAMV